MRQNQSPPGQFFHDISYLGCHKPDLLQFFIMGKYLAWRTIQCHFSLIHYNQPVYKIGHVLHAVRYNDNSYISLSVKFCDELVDLIPSLGIQSCRRFVQDQHIRLHSQHTGNGHPPFLPSRQLQRGYIQILFTYPHLLQCFKGAHLHFQWIQPHIFRAKLNIFDDGAFKQLMLRILKYQTDLAAQFFHGKIFIMYIFSIEINGSFCRL